MARNVTSRVKFWQKKLLLSDWKIAVEVGPLDDGSRADCDAKPEYREAKIRLDPDKIDAEELDGFCIHELLHCHTWRLEALAERVTVPIRPRCRRDGGDRPGADHPQPDQAWIT
jgi:hypothetical protein